MNKAELVAAMSAKTGESKKVTDIEVILHRQTSNQKK